MYILKRNAFLLRSTLAIAGTLMVSCTAAPQTIGGEKAEERAAQVASSAEPETVDLETESPAWIEQAIVYGVIPRNFGPSGFQSVTEKLDDLKDLGVNAIWLSPINATPEGDFGYAVTDYFDVRDDYGTKEDVRELVQAAHQRGIRVLMDFVPNHTSDQHPYFQDAQAKGRESEYYDWYDRDENGDYTYYFGWTHLPNLNLDNPEVQRWMLDAFSYWVKEFDVDGFRVDVAWGIKERKPELWPKWIKELRQIKPDLLMLAEASARDPYYFTSGFDAAFDWTDELGHWAWENVFDERTKLTERLHAALTNEGRGYHPDALIFRFLNNNDTDFRFVTRYGLNMTRVAAALLLTLPGIPCIYTGDEVGAEFRPYHDPWPIQWKDNYDLRDDYKQLVTLRTKIPSLRSRHWQPLELTPAQHVYGYVRYLKPAGQPVLVLLNFSHLDVVASVSVPQDFQELTRNASLLDVLANEQIPIDRSETLQVPMRPWSARIMAGSEVPGAVPHP